MSRVPTLWKVLFGLILACLLACVLTWFVLLTNLCSNPRKPNAATQNTIPYGCHGMTVCIIPLERDLLHWLGPVLCASCGFPLAWGRGCALGFGVLSLLVASLAGRQFIRILQLGVPIYWPVVSGWRCFVGRGSPHSWNAPCKVTRRTSRLSQPGY